MATNNSTNATATTSTANKPNRASRRGGNKPPATVPTSTTATATPALTHATVAPVVPLAAAPPAVPATSTTPYTVVSRYNKQVAYTLASGSKAYCTSVAVGLAKASPSPLPAGHALAVLATSAVPVGTVALPGYTPPTSVALPSAAPSTAPATGSKPRTLAPVGTASPAASTGGAGNGSTGRTMPNSKVRVLHLLAAAPQGLTRKQLATATGQVKGWAALLGAPTKGTCLPGTLQGAGLVHSAVYEGTRGMVYTITPAGRAYLATLPAAAPTTAAPASPAPSTAS